MTGAEARSSVHSTGNGKGATRERQSSIFRRAGQPLECYPVTVWGSRRAGRTNFGLLNAFVGGTIVDGNPNGESGMKNQASGTCSLSYALDRE